MDASPRQVLESGAAELGITLNEDQLDRFDAFTSLLLEWNQRLNLTRITDPGEIAVKHYLDSLSLLAVIEVPMGASLVDVGTGAGMPAIPLKIVRPDLTVTMLDSVRKKLSFIETAVQELGIGGADVLHARAEDAGRDKRYREQFDLSVSRAVARLSVLSELCIPFCKVGGWFAAYKGPEAAEEIAEADRAIGRLGGELTRAEALCLPGGEGGRTLILIHKERRTPPGFPRKAGTPERQPL